jgi:hypothetical protein
MFLLSILISYFLLHLFEDVERSTKEAVDDVLKRFEPKGGLPWPTYSIDQMKFESFFFLIDSDNNCICR